jgi:hypothetical protein
VKKIVHSVKALTMAKWVGEGTPPYTGTVDCLTIYQLPDQKWYVRMRSSITGKRIKKDPVFEGFRNSSFRMKDASPIASKVYQQLAGKHYPLFREMTGKALLWLKAGLTVKDITAKLIAEYMPVVKRTTKAPLIKRIPLPLKPQKRRPTNYLRPLNVHLKPAQRPVYRVLSFRYSVSDIRSPVSS